MKKELSIEHIIQYITNRYQYYERWDKFSFCSKKTLLCVSEWEKHQLSWLPVISDSLCHIARRFHVTFWGWINIWASIIQCGNYLPLSTTTRRWLDAIVILKKKPTPSPSTIYWVNVQLTLLRNTRHFWMSRYLSSHVITTSVNPLRMTLIQYSITRRQHSYDESKVLK
jgi:hypothetical protein